jgi:hypothetical protein
MTETVTPGPARVAAQPIRRRRRLDLRTIATGVAVLVAVAWIIVFGVGLFLR